MYDSLIYFNPLPQDIPFLVLAGTQTTVSFTVPAFFSIMAALVGIVAYFVFLCQEWGSIPTYLSWLRGEVGKLPCVKRVKGRESAVVEAQGPAAQAPPTQQQNHATSESEQSEDDSQVRRCRGGGEGKGGEAVM